MSTPALTIQDMQESARARGGKCISSVYRNNKTKLLWQCAKRHVWEARADQIRKRVGPTWCPHCSGKVPKTIDELRTMAACHGGKLLSTEARGMHHLHVWRCKTGHVFEMKPNNVRFGHWCPGCWNGRRGLNAGRKKAR